MTISSRIRSELFTLPSNNTAVVGADKLQLIRLPLTHPLMKSTRFPSRRNGASWTNDEHERFLRGLELFPSGPWKQIANVVGTKNTRQTMTHAQKYRQKIARRQRGLFMSVRSQGQKEAVKPEPVKQMELPPTSPSSHASSLLSVEVSVKQDNADVQDMICKANERDDHSYISADTPAVVAVQPEVTWDLEELDFLAGLDDFIGSSDCVERICDQTLSVLNTLNLCVPTPSIPGSWQDAGTIEGFYYDSGRSSVPICHDDSFLLHL